MSLLDVLLGAIVPHDCINCGREGGLFCTGCISETCVPPECCYRCRQPSPAALCSQCAPKSPLKQIRAVAVYDGAPKKLVWRLKYDGAQAAAKSMAESMLPLLPKPAGLQSVIVPVPTASARVRQRGYDQATLLAKELSRLSGLPRRRLLSRQGQAHQVGANRQQRLAQLENAFCVNSASGVSAIRLILVDDVLTTGATLEAAARSLQRAGARHVEAVVYAQAV